MTPHDDVRLTLRAFRWATGGEMLVVTKSVASVLRGMGIVDGYVVVDTVAEVCDKECRA